MHHHWHRVATRAWKVPCRTPAPSFLPLRIPAEKLKAKLPTHRPPLPQPCVFRVDYALEQAGGKEFGTVFINEKENVAATLLAAGWAKVSCWVQCLPVGMEHAGGCAR